MPRRALPFGAAYPPVLSDGPVKLEPGIRSARRPAFSRTIWGRPCSVAAAQGLAETSYFFFMMLKRDSGGSGAEQREGSFSNDGVTLGGVSRFKLIERLA